MVLTVPQRSLVVLIGPSGSGKSTFAARHFRPTEIVSSDRCRAWVCDDETDQSANADAFAVLHRIVSSRLARGKLTVVDATNVESASRRQLLDLARHYHLPAVAVVLALPEELCLRRNADRSRHVPDHVITAQTRLLTQTPLNLPAEGFHEVMIVHSPEEVDSLTVQRVPLPVDRSGDHGPFDVIGDVHGCSEELVALLTRLGYAVQPVAECPIADGPGFRVEPPRGRQAVFVGDLCDRGPDTPAVLKLVMGMIATGAALCVRGNHEEKLLKALDGRAAKVSKGLQRSLDQLAAEPPTFRTRVRAFLDSLVSHYVLAGGELVVAHAGLPEDMHGRMSKAVTAFALYGDTTGDNDADGFPIRRDWAQHYRGAARVVYGHVMTWEPKWIHRTLCIDTGCVFGGRLTAWRYPEDELLDVPAQRVYFAPKRPLGPAATDPATSRECQEKPPADAGGSPHRVEANNLS